MSIGKKVRPSEAGRRAVRAFNAKRWEGTIVGESYDKGCWIVVRDGNSQNSRSAIHKKYLEVVGPMSDPYGCLPLYDASAATVRRAIETGGLESAVLLLRSFADVLQEQLDMEAAEKKEKTT